jgi:hypothetical protein
MLTIGFVSLYRCDDLRSILSISSAFLVVILG